MQSVRASRRLLVLLSSLFFFLMSVAALLLSSSHFYSTPQQQQQQQQQTAAVLLPSSQLHDAVTLPSSPPSLAVLLQQQPPVVIPPPRDAADHGDAAHQHVFDTAHGHMHEVLSPDELLSRERQRKADLDRMVLCLRWRRDFSIVSNNSWGRAPADAQQRWRDNRCDAAVSVAAYRDHLQQHPELFAPIVVPASRVGPGARSSGLEVIAICVCTTTRGIRVNNLNDLMLFKSLLPSIVRPQLTGHAALQPASPSAHRRSASDVCFLPPSPVSCLCQAQHAEPGYEYWIYLLYDQGDEFFDKEERLSAVRQWFAQFVVAPLTVRGIHSRLVLTAFDNAQHKPGPAFNFLTHLAFIDGADWLYRINDDTLFMSPFASALVAALRAFGPPFGAVGPLCRDGNIHILTHDFTSRLHHTIFGRHYPPMLTDWWMDDWITRVYGRRRTKRLDEVVVRHLLRSHGTRYNVDFSHEDMLDQEVELSRQAVEDWMRKQGMTDELQLYQRDEFKFKLE